MTRHGIPCPVPDCDDGLIDGDGYCDVCGTAYEPPPPTVETGGRLGSAATAEPRGPNGCADPDCDGRVADGYCDTCGLADAPAQPAAAGGSGGSGSSASTTGGSSRSRRSTRRTSARSRLGAGLVEVRQLPAPDPTSLLIDEPQVPEHRRFCPNPDCAKPVGRRRGKRPGRVEGYCVACQTHYSFVPALKKGDRVGPYQIAGAIAHGGQGWIYLAQDTGVSADFWVVLKGLLGTGDADAHAAAVAERRFLAAVDHTSIVKIYTFVEHAGSGYIVMEYVGGTSLRALLANREAAAGNVPDPLPVADAVAYILAVLPAFAYLHRNGLLFCDFKLDNVMLVGDTLKLIDLGAVRRMDDDTGAIYYTEGYDSPELLRVGPSVASDLYAVGRTLAMLILNFRGNRTEYRHRLPPVVDHPPLARYDSLYRFLRKATAELPDDRFTSADEMHDELLGVLREVVAAEGGKPAPAPSRVFTPDRHPTGEDPDGGRAGPPWAVLPALRVDPADEAAATLAALPETAPAALAELLATFSPRTVGVRLRLARALLEAQRPDEARGVLAEVAAEDPWEWRVRYYRGLLALAAADPGGAREEFDAVYAQVPGELAPKLALAFAAEAAGDPAYAEKMYDVVSRTDDGFTSAAFGLARVRTAAGDRAGAVAAYRRVPASSAAYLEAQVRLARVLGTVTAAGTPASDDVAEAARVLDGLDLDPGRRAALTRDLLTTALELVRSGALAATDDVRIAGVPVRENPLRFALERVYRELAKLAPSPTARYELVDRANSVRPRTLV